MKKIYIIICSILIIIFISIVCYIINEEKKNFNTNITINYSLSKILVEQEKINLEIEEISESNKYTLDNPKVIVNPFKISPLTALIIFNTNYECEINVNINNEYYFKTEKSKKHIIPIYGMYDNENNNVILTTSNDDKKELIIVTEQAKNVNKLDVLTSKSNNFNNLYFMTSPVGTSASAYDENGNLKWYLTEKYTMDFEWLENGHFLVGIPESSVNDRKIGFVEMDYLGKIYNYYILEHGYEFEFQILKNGNYMLCGGDKAVFYDKAWIYEIDPTTGKLIDYIDLYEIFKSVDSNFDESKLNYKIIRNAFYFNEESNELLVSLRGLNSVISIDYVTKKINYIFAPSNIYSDKFDDYMVSLKSGRFPLGIHSVFFTEEGYIGFINNGYDRYNGFEVGGEDKVSSYKDSYSSAEIYSISEKKAELIWSYDYNKELFTHQYGSFNIFENKKIINFGWILEESYRNNKYATLSESEKNTDNTYAKIIELNNNDEIIFEANIDDGKYRVFKHSLYTSKMNNFDYSISNFFNTVPISDKEIIYTKNIKDKLLNAIPFNNNITYTSYSIDTDYIFDIYDEVDILLVGKNKKSYKIPYKKEGENVNKSLNIELEKGEYALYLIINNIYFNTDVKVLY